MYSDAGAIISGDELSRWLLWREWDHSDQLTIPYVLWIMLNPSTADGLLDDPTIRRCVSFTKAAGYSRLEVVNLFSWRATKPSALKQALKTYPTHIVVGDENWTTLSSRSFRASLIVCAWGGLGNLAHRGSDVVTQLHDLGYGPKIRHLGLTDHGHPRHPLFVPASQELQPWTTSLLYCW